MPFFEPPTKVKNSLTVGKQSIGFSDPDIINFMNPGKAGKYISAETALQNSDIYSAVNQLSSDLSTVVLKSSMPRTQGMLDNPSATSNHHAFWQSMYAQLLLGGEAFAYRWHSRNGIDQRWEYLRPSQVSTYLLDDGTGLTYTVTFDEPNLGVLQYVPQGDMIHLRLLSQNGGMTGVSPLAALSDELNIKDTSNNLTLSALKRSISSPGVLSIQHGGLLDGKQKAARSRQFMRQVSASDSGPVVLDQLEEYKPLEMKANVAQLLSQTDWTSRQIAKVFGIPDSYLNGQGDQQSSIVQIKGMYANALNRYMQSIVSELDNKLNAHITANIRPAIDPLGDAFATTLSGLAKDGTLANNQATWVLQQSGYFPEDMPEAQQPPTQLNNTDSSSTKGGEDNEND